MARKPVYRAVFLRMHPTGKAVLSLTEESKGKKKEATLGEVAANELGIPPEDIKVVHEDTDRFGKGNSFKSSPSDVVAENVAITARKLRDKAQLIAALMLESSPDALRWDDGQWSVTGGGEGSVKIQEVALRAFGADSLPEGLDGGLDAQTTYKIEASKTAS